MKLILRKEVASLGHIGDVIVAKDGYARNYLVPRGIAYAASPNNLRQLEEEKKQSGRRDDKERKLSESVAAAIANTSVTITMKVGEDEKLFGSVTSQMIADSLLEKGITVDKRTIELEEPLKALGIYDVSVKLPGGVVGTVKVWVERE
jgi:large subunit ribosomal protein L9